MTRASITTNAAYAPPAATPKLVCRRIADDDLEAAVTLLTRGFPERSADYWRQGLQRLHDRPLSDDCPRYGYLLAADGAPVGILLLIFAGADDGTMRVNVSSWFVLPDYRAYSSLLLAPAFRMKGVTCLNISPSPGTFDTIAAQGFARYVEGTFHAIAALGPRVPGARVRRIMPTTPDAPSLLVEHAACGCICLEVRLAGEAFPFVFVPSRGLRGRVPAAQLVYCRSVGEFARFAGPLGRYLARRGLPWVMLDANGPIPELVGRYRGGRRPKYFRGPRAPRLCDLSSTELVYFGP